METFKEIADSINQVGLANVAVVALAFGTVFLLKWLFREPSEKSPKGGYGRQLIELLVELLAAARDGVEAMKEYQGQTATALTQTTLAVTALAATDLRLEESLKAIMVTLHDHSRNHGIQAQMLLELSNVCEALAVAAGKDVSVPMAQIRAICKQSDGEAA